MAVPTRFIPEDELRYYYVELKWKQDRLARHYHCCRETVRYWLETYGIPIRLPGGGLKYYIPEEELRRLYLELKWSRRKIGLYYGCDEGTVLHRLKKYDIPIRACAEAALERHNHLGLMKPYDGDIGKKGWRWGFSHGDCSYAVATENSLIIQVICNTTKQEQRKVFEEQFSEYAYVHVGKLQKEGEITLIAHFLIKQHPYLLDWKRIKDEELDCIPPDILADPVGRLGAIGGYTDAEGNIDTSCGYAGFRLQSCDMNVLHQIYNVFVDLSIECPPPRLDKPAGYVIGGTPLRKDYWCLGIYKKQSLWKLFNPHNGILCPYMHHPKRLRDIKAALTNIERRSSASEWTQWEEDVQNTLVKER